MKIEVHVFNNLVQDVEESSHLRERSSTCFFIITPQYIARSVMLRIEVI